MLDTRAEEEGGRGLWPTCPAVEGGGTNPLCLCFSLSLFLRVYIQYNLSRACVHMYIHYFCEIPHLRPHSSTPSLLWPTPLSLGRPCPPQGPPVSGTPRDKVPPDNQLRRRDSRSFARVGRVGEGKRPVPSFVIRC